MKTDEELYDGIDDKYKAMQKELAKHKIGKARAKIKRLCSAEITQRDITLIVDCRDAIDFWENSYKW